MSLWPWWVPILAILSVVASSALPLTPWVLAGCGLVLVGAVIASVHHAEVVAHRLGEPMGTVVLSICVTVIEVALISTVMLSGAPGAASSAPKLAMACATEGLGAWTFKLARWSPTGTK